MKSITVQRNAKIVGNNSMSYDDKHPHATITLRPIKDALHYLRGAGEVRAKMRGAVASMGNLDKPDMLRGIAQAKSGL